MLNEGKAELFFILVKPNWTLGSFKKECGSSCRPHGALQLGKPRTLDTISKVYMGIVLQRRHTEKSAE